MYAPTDLAVYIHWPFCKSKCPYCDFYSRVNPAVDQEALVDEYIAALKRYAELTPERTVQSVFFGGGTPSLVKPQNIAKLLNTVAECWPLAEQAEISLEANPNSRGEHLFADLRAAGINRLSLGVQALNEADLRFLGRTHTLEQARLCLKEAVRTFANHSADLIYARPQQTMKSWQSELAEITRYGLKHISLYQLTIEENTVFARKNVQPLDEDAAAEMYTATVEYLAPEGYEHYEVSNFARNGFACRHNLTYWQGGDYVGIGASAHGRLCLHGVHTATVYPFIHTPLTAEERAKELILLGLRLTAGLDKRRFKQICGLDLAACINREQLQMLTELQLLEDTADFLVATPAGMLLLDEIIRRLCN